MAAGVAPMAITLIAAVVLWPLTKPAPPPPTPRPITAAHPRKLSAFDLMSRGDDAFTLVRLIESNPKLATERDANGQSWLWNAAKFNRVECAAILLSKGADPNEGGHGVTPFELGIKNGGRELLKLQLHAGGKSPQALHIAAQNGKADMILILLSEGFDVNEREPTMMATALQRAAWVGEQQAVAVLLENGADVDAEDSLGYTALDWAMYGGHTRISSIIRAAGGDIGSSTARKLIDKTGKGRGAERDHH